MVKTQSVFLAALLIFILTGCAAKTAKEPTEAAKSGAPLPLTASDFDAGRQQAEAFQKVFWQVYQGGDPALLAPFLPEKRSPQEVANQILRQKTAIEKRYGSMTGARFGVEMEKPFVRDYFWVVRFEKKPAPGAAAAPTTPAVTEFLFLVRVARVQDKVKVIGFGLRP